MRRLPVLSASATTTDPFDSADRAETRGATLTPARRNALAEEVAATLRDAIMAGQFAPGQPLREELLAASLDVSRGPIREALSMLEREGLVIVRRHRGARVARLARKDLDDVYSLRVALEQLAVRLAAERAKEADFVAMAGFVEQMRLGVARETSERAAADLDVRFHDLIYHAAGNDRLHEAWQNIRSQVYIFLLSRNVARSDLRSEAVIAHQAILDVLRRRDGPAAAEVIERHIRLSYERILERFPDAGSEPAASASSGGLFDSAVDRAYAKRKL